MRTIWLLLFVVIGSLTATGCFWEDSQKKFIKSRQARPMFCEKMTPAQRDYYEGLNNNTKKLITGYSSQPEQWEAFMSHWKAHTRSMNN